MIEPNREHKWASSIIALEGSFRPFRPIFGHSKPILALFDHIYPFWHHLQFWPFVAIYGPFRPNFSRYRQFWPTIGKNLAISGL